MSEIYKAKITPSYMLLRSIYVGADALQRLRPGTVTVLADKAVLADKDGEELSIEGKLNPQGYLTGMAKLYRALQLKDGTTLAFSVSETGNLIINSIIPPVEYGPTAVDGSIPPPLSEKTVFERQNLKHMYIEPFRPENLNHWEPETETDVYLAFGWLQDYTDYQYCCGASTALLRQLGANYDEKSKPDAILVDRTTSLYLMAEWKKFSSEYKHNHMREDTDVLVCCYDDEKDRTTLPPRVLELHAVAKTAATATLSEE